MYSYSLMTLDEREEILSISDNNIHDAIGVLFKEILSSGTLKSQKLRIASSKYSEYDVDIKPLDEYGCDKDFEIRYEILKDAHYFPGFEFRKIDEGLIITGMNKGFADCKSFLEVLEIPRTEVFNGKKEPIVGIDEFAFVGESFEKVLIPETVKYLEDNAFVGCENLKEVRFFGVFDDEIFLEDKFKKDVPNILFLNFKKANFKMLKTDNYIVMQFVDIFKNKLSEYSQNKRKKALKLVKIPDIEDVYIPDFYKGFCVDMREFTYRGYKGDSSEILDNVRRIRFPEFCPQEAISPNTSLDVVFSKNAENVWLPTFVNKAFIYEKAKFIEIGEELKVFPVEEDLKDNLESFHNNQKYNDTKMRLDSYTFLKNYKKEGGFIKEKGIAFAVDRDVRNVSYFVMPDDVYFMVDGLLRESNFSEVVLNSKVKYISNECFKDCGKLKEITIPAQVEMIGVKAFAEEAYVDVRDEEVDCCKDVTFEGDENSIKIKAKAFAREMWLPFT